jgi:predicted NBD/HSP70 family sugar kinase
VDETDGAAAAGSASPGVVADGRAADVPTDDGSTEGVEPAHAPRPSYAQVRARIHTALTTGDEFTLNDLADRARTSRPTARRAVDDLIGLGFGEVRGTRQADTGRPAEVFGPAEGTRHVLALDTRAEGNRARVISWTGVLRSERLGAPTSTDVLADLVALAQGALKDAGIDSAQVDEQVSHGVVAVPGVVDAEGAIALSVVVPALTGRRLGEELGAARGLRDVVHLNNHGTLRPSMVIGGRIRRGANWALGEGDVLELTGVVPEALTHRGRTVPFKQIAALVDRGELDPDWLVPFHDAFARILALVAYLVDPEAILISGGPVSTAPDAMADLEKRVRALSAHSQDVHLLAGSEGDASLEGAEVLALRLALSAALEIPDPTIPAVRHPAPSSAPDPNPPHRPTDSPTTQ